jgi:hypothetical protein
MFSGPGLVADSRAGRDLFVPASTVARCLARQVGWRAGEKNFKLL